MKFFLKLCFIIILLIISINPADSLELAVENVKDFKVVDWNNDGKTDIVLYFIDGKFGVMLNLSKNDSEFNFSEIKYLSKQTEKNEENMKNAVSGENNAYAVNRSKDNIKKSDVENEKGISISKEELLKFINDETEKSDISIKKSKPEPKKINDSSKNKNINENNSVNLSEPEKKLADKNKIDNSFNEKYDICILNFINESDIKFASDVEWLKSGIPELLMYELTLDEKIKIMPRELSTELKPDNTFDNVSIIISGSFRTSEKDLILTVNINNKKRTHQIKISGSKDNNGILTLISQAGKQLNDEVNKNLK